jgi:hypothetical protein
MKLDLNNVGDKLVPERYPRKFPPALAIPRRFVRGLRFDKSRSASVADIKLACPTAFRQDRHTAWNRLPYGRKKASFTGNVDLAALCPRGVQKIWTCGEQARSDVSSVLWVA